MESFKIELRPQTPTSPSFKILVNKVRITVKMKDGDKTAVMVVNMPMAQALGSAIVKLHNPSSFKAQLAQILLTVPTVMAEFKAGTLTRENVEVIFSLLAG